MSERNLYARLLDMIAEGDLGTGGRLPTERALAERFGTTRRAVRHALDALEEDGLVWRRQGSGTYAGLPTDPTGDLAARIVGQTDARQIMEARLCIEPTLAALAATRMTDLEVARLKALARQQIEATDAHAMEVWDGALHRLIAQCARNQPLLTAFALLDRIRSDADWVAIRAHARTADSIAITRAEHGALIDAIAARDAKAAEAAMRRHLRTRSKALTQELDRINEASIQIG